MNVDAALCFPKSLEVNTFIIITGTQTIKSVFAHIQLQLGELRDIYVHITIDLLRLHE
jgi:hypothetical protein